MQNIEKHSVSDPQPSTNRPSTFRRWPLVMIFGAASALAISHYHRPQMQTASHPCHPIADQVFRPYSPRCGFVQLLSNPLVSGSSGNGAYTIRRVCSSMITKIYSRRKNKSYKTVKSQAQMSRIWFLKNVTKSGLTCYGALEHIFLNCALDNIDLQLQQLAAGAFCSPQSVFTTGDGFYIFLGCPVASGTAIVCSRFRKFENPVCA